MNRTLAVSLGWMIAIATAQAQLASADISEIMMQSTFLVRDERGPACGTGFVVVKRQTNGAANVFITADHVLTNLVSEYAVIMLRINTGPDKWELAPRTNRIRDGTNILYFKHPRLDIAAFYIGLPEKCLPNGGISEDLLLAEQTIRDIKVGPGTELLNLGYPFGLASGPEQFASLRSGRVASYPILPVAQRPSFELAVTAFGGNSGGPVYVSNYVTPGTEHILPNPRHFGVVGMLTTSKSLVQTMQLVDESITRHTHLGFAGVIHAHFIKETLDLLPKQW